MFICIISVHVYNSCDSYCNFRITLKQYFSDPTYIVICNQHKISFKMIYNMTILQKVEFLVQMAIFLFLAFCCHYGTQDVLIEVAGLMMNTNVFW